MWIFVMAAFIIQALGTECHSCFLKRPVNPEVLLSASQIICYWKYPLEVHEVETADSYILTLHRIPYGRAGNKVPGQRPVIFLQHGLLSSAVTWISNLPNNSLAFILADAGFDVWMGNSRGNTYSLKHATLSTNSKEYWAFSFDEMARYDLPASIDYIVKKTGQKIYYVGHSQGTLIGFLAFSTLPELSQKVKALYALAPGISIKHTRSLPFRLLFMMRQSMLKMMRITSDGSAGGGGLYDGKVEELLLGNKDVLPETAITKFLATTVCNNKITGVICGKIILSFYGFNPKNINMSRIDVYVSHGLQGTSSQNLLHYAQSFHDIENVTRAYDYGTRKENLAHYNQPTPPRYNLSSMRVPIALWSGQKDLVTDPEDVAILVSQIPNLIYHKTLPKYTHLDFIFGVNAPEDIYNEIINMIKKSQ
ncbi:gastric triacylglycerol lipase-like [Gracilinanus agilis]|uniref:gastric triacylglycerol lipase-like n=1 Tax=Gracilinanus agilis TaxID=191870 RepID=UPI001CFE28D1|nr:gastric triacylglycerol lipase-like [Gracilinanus agilis]